jgi:hypothetical protein
MCTSIIEIARAEGMAKRGDEWFPLTRAVVAYDHARHAPLGDVITLDFINTDLEPGARAGIELTLQTAKELRAALNRAIAAAEFEEAEVRGKGSGVDSLFGLRDSDEPTLRSRRRIAVRGKAIDEKTARLKALRLAKEEAESEAPPSAKVGRNRK